MKTFPPNYQKKLISLLIAFCVWFVINRSISSVRTFEKVPIRVVNIPVGKTLANGDSDGVLYKRVDITVRGTKDVLSKVSAHDLEVVIDATSKGDEWIAKIGPRNITSNRTDFPIVEAIRDVQAPECIIHLSPLAIARVPIYIQPPRGNAPEGFQFVDVFPRVVYHTVYVPQEEVAALERDGIELQFDLNALPIEEIQKVVGAKETILGEVSVLVPDAWKKIQIGKTTAPQMINGPEAKYLRFDFLANRLLPYEGMLPVTLFFPQNTVDIFNPTTLRLLPSSLLEQKNGIFFLPSPMYIHGVSSLFLNAVSNRMEIVIVPQNINKKIEFTYELQFIAPELLEESYVTLALSSVPHENLEGLSAQAVRQYLMEQEQQYRLRFRQYMRVCQVYQDQWSILNLSINVSSDGGVNVSKKGKTS